MRFIEMGLAFAVIGFVAANAVLSALTALLWGWMRRLPLRADALFLLRMLPALGSAALVLGVIVPAYLLFEPRQTSERVGPALVVVALVARSSRCGIWRALGWLDARLKRVAGCGGPDDDPSIPYAGRVRTLMPLPRSSESSVRAFRVGAVPRPLAGTSGRRSSTMRPRTSRPSTI
jgi:hypothetical protein